MKTKLSIKAGEKGTKKLCEKFGESLVCVRYRYDDTNKKRYKTVELIIEETDWEPTENSKQEKIGKQKDEMLVGVRIGIGEGRLQQEMRNAGGKWNRQNQLWEIGYETALRLGLKDRVEKFFQRTPKVAG